MDAPTRLVTSVDVDEKVVDVHQVSVSARHEAELSDGRRVLLLDDRGWSQSGPADIWALTSAEDIARTARVVVGPDEPSAGRSHEDLASDHWAQLAATLRLQGVATEPAELRRLPHDVVLSRTLLARLGEPAGENRGRRDEDDR